MDNLKNVVIIGNGIAAKLLAFTLFKEKKIKCTMIANDSFAPMCSTRSTAINCLRGTQKGISKLGDLIVDSYDDFIQFYNTYFPKGVEKSFEIQLWDKDHEKWSRRYTDSKHYKNVSNIAANFKTTFYGHKNEAYLFNPKVFFDWLDSQFEFEFINDYVINVSRNDHWKVESQNGLEITAKNIIICTSYESEIFSSLIVEEQIQHRLVHSKPVSGTYLKFNINDFVMDQFISSQAFSLAINNMHFVYRPFAGDVLIGSTSNNNSKCFLPEKEKAKKIYDEITQYLSGSVDVPSFEKASLVTGVRHKGQKRSPFWGKINENCFGVWGLYKNGYTFAFKAALEITKAIN